MSHFHPRILLEENREVVLIVEDIGQLGLILKITFVEDEVFELRVEECCKAFEILVGDEVGILFRHKNFYF